MLKKVKKFFDREENLLVHIIATIIVNVLGLFFHIKPQEWFLIYIMICFVITSELLNSAIELAVDNYTNSYNDKAKIAKDVAAGAVLVSAITAVIIGIYVFLPYILKLV